MKVLKYYWISIILAAIILFLCFMHVDPLPKAPVANLDKWAHLGMFFSLSATMFFENTYYFKRKITYRRMFWGSFVIPVILSGAIEIMQTYLIRYRTGDWMDFLYDMIGIVISLLICLMLNDKLPLFKKN